MPLNAAHPPRDLPNASNSPWVGFSSFFSSSSRLILMEKGCRILIKASKRNPRVAIRSSSTEVPSSIKYKQTLGALCKDIVYEQRWFKASWFVGWTHLSVRSNHSWFSFFRYCVSSLNTAFFLFWLRKYHQMNRRSMRHAPQQQTIVTPAGIYLGASLGRNVWGPGGEDWLISFSWSRQNWKKHMYR